MVMVGLMIHHGLSTSGQSPPIQILKAEDDRRSDPTMQVLASVETKDMSSVAGDTSEGSTAVPRLGSIEELDEEVLRELHEMQTANAVLAQDSSVILRLLANKQHA